MRLTDTIKTAHDLREQYKDSTNLKARAAIYRFLWRPSSWPAWVMDQMLAEIPASAEVLEIGAGPGGLWRGQLDRVPASWRIILTDLMSGMVDEAAAALAQDARFTVRQMNAEKLDFPDEKFDAVVANHMLYHVDDRPRAFAEIRRVLKCGGKVIAGTNSENHLRRMGKLIGEFLGDSSPFKDGIAFSLENGGQQLRPFFGDVIVKSSPNELRVTEADAVVQYVLSVEGAKERIVGPRLAELRARVQREIEAAGAWIDQTEAGVFIATKNSSA